MFEGSRKKQILAIWSGSTATQERRSVVTVLGRVVKDSKGKI